jgi:hypothetical protein
MKGIGVLSNHKTVSTALSKLNAKQLFVYAFGLTITAINKELLTTEEAVQMTELAKKQARKL